MSDHDLDSLRTTWSSWTPLHFAAFKNNVDLCLAHCTPDEVNKLDRNGRSPLQIAIENQHFETISVLVKHGASIEYVEAISDDNRTFEHPDYFELGVQLLPIVKMPLKFLLQLASHAGSTNQPGIMSMIIQNEGFSSFIFNTYDCMGLTPAHHAALGGSLECIKLLIDNGGIMTKLSKTDLSYPIHFACSKGYGDIFDVLMRVSSSNALNSQNVTGHTPFHLALYNGHWELVSSFSSFLKMCDANIVDIDGHSVQGLLFHMRNNGLISHEFQSAIPCLTLDEANWLLHNSISDQDEKLLCYALQQKADPNCFDLMQQTPLMHAAKLGCSEMCLSLLENGADQTIKDWNGRTALHYSAHRGNVHSTKTLLQFEGADCFSLSVDLYTPLDLAFIGGQLDVVDELLRAMKRNSSRQLPCWVKSLSLAVMCATTSILQEMTCYFPENWIEILIAKSNTSIQSEYDELISDTHRNVSRSILKKYVPLPPSQKIVWRDLKNRSKIKQKRMQQIENARKHEPFRNIMRTRVKRKSFRVQTKETYYPFHQALYSRNKDAFLFLMREAHNASMLEQFLMSKGPSKITVAELISSVLPEMISQWSIEEDIYQCLSKLFILDDKMSFPLALLHHIVSGIIIVTYLILIFDSMLEIDTSFLFQFYRSFHY